MSKAEETIIKRLTKSNGQFNTQDARLAKVAQKMEGVQHVFSCDLGDGKITHRFMFKQTCNS